MGKASKWFRAALGLKKPDPPPPPPQQQTSDHSRSKEKRRWSFVKSYREKDHQSSSATSSSTKYPVLYGQGADRAVLASQTSGDPNKRAVQVVAAEVVRVTSSGRPAAANTSDAAYVSKAGLSEDLASVKIQAAFRGYLARRALRALRAVVRLQALVRGHIVRKRTSEWLHRMQALLRAQARARAGRNHISESWHLSGKSSHSHNPMQGPPTPEKFERAIQARSGKYDHSSMLERTGSKSNGRAIGEEDEAYLSFNWSERRVNERPWDDKAIGEEDKACFSFNWSERQVDKRTWDQGMPSSRTGTIDDEKSDKILEIDSGKPHFTPMRRNLYLSSYHAFGSDQNSHSFTTSKDSTTHQLVRSPSSGAVQYSSPWKFSHDVEEAFCTAENSPQVYSASSRGRSGRRSPYTPTRSDGSLSFLSGYSDYPNYMSYTESSRAKVRPLSAPKQRPQYERSSSTKRYSMHGFCEPRSSSAQRGSNLRANFTSKAYPGSGRLDRLGMPIGQGY